MIKTPEAQERKRIRNRAYQKRLREEKMASQPPKISKAIAKPKEQTTMPSIKFPTFKPKEIERMDNVVLSAYKSAVNSGNFVEAEIIRCNPRNVGVDWNLIVEEQINA